MKILLIGTGGREHALAWKISASALCTQLFLARGNGGTIPWNVALNPDNHSEVLAFCQKEAIDLIVIGPEQPLSEGLADILRSAGFLVCGPGKAGAQLEGSKVYSKAFMEKYHIPTASARSFDRDEYDEALHFLLQQSLPVVVKVDGLAAGKGVTVAHTQDEAMQALEEIFHENKFGTSGDSILIESFLLGKEVSVFVLTDGTHWICLPEAMDYKRAGEKNEGPNTGGMGALSPVPFYTPAIQEYVNKFIIEPTLKGLKAEGIEYRGFIFFGLMVDEDEARVIEYNVRMGDPETEVVLPRIDSDILPYLYGAASGALPESPLKVSPKTAVTTVCVSEGYPGEYKKGFELSLPASREESLLFFHAGTKAENGKLLTAGGRVMAVTAVADSLREAAERSQSGAGSVQYAGKYFRHDIGTIY